MMFIFFFFAFHLQQRTEQTEMIPKKKTMEVNSHERFKNKKRENKVMFVLWLLNALHVCVFFFFFLPC